MPTAHVRLLNGKDFITELPKDADGQALLDEVCKSSQLREKEYFGLTFLDTDQQTSWLKLSKSLKKQLKDEWYCEFRLKFYPPTPESLKDDLTKYHIFLQIHRDLVSKRLPATTEQYIFLGALTILSELGDYNAVVHHGNYASRVPFAPLDIQNAGMEHSVMELHKKFPRGMKLDQIENEYLQFAKTLAWYGVAKYEVKYAENKIITLGVSSSGLQEYDNNTMLASYYWSQTLKFSYRRHTFYVDVRSRRAGEKDERIAYACTNEKAAKRLWKVCIENHSFFRGFPKTETEEKLFRTRSFRLPADKRQDRKPIIVRTEVKKQEGIPEHVHETKTVIQKSASGSEDEGIYFKPKETLSQPEEAVKQQKTDTKTVVREDKEEASKSGTTSSKTVVTKIVTTERLPLPNKAVEEDTRAREAVYASIQDVLHKKRGGTTTTVVESDGKNSKTVTVTETNVQFVAGESVSDSSDDDWAFQKAVQQATGLSTDVHVKEVESRTRIKLSDEMML